MKTKPPSKLLDFHGKNVLVTGSSVGLGAGIAKRFAQAGADVIINYRTHHLEAKSIVGWIEKLGRRSMAIQADVTNQSQVISMFDEVEQKFSPIDVLINNAGAYPQVPLLDMSEVEWDEMLDTNLKSIFLCTQTAARRMVARGLTGSIVNISSLSAVNPAYGHCHYTAAKAGVLMFTKTAALELGHYGIRINAVGPGLVNSPILSSAWPEGVARWMNKVPLGRLGEPEDVADACLFLSSDAARFITGIHLLVEGGVFTNPIY